jgi:hypothetical protein
MTPAMLFEMAGEFLFLKAGREIPKRITLGSPLEDSQPCSALSEQNSSTADSSAMIEMHSSVPNGKGKEIASQVPECTSQVRRSTRSNKYDGFNHKNLSEARTVKSKVKPRKVPSVKPKINKSKKTTSTATLLLDSDVLKDTPIPVMQSIGINLCGVPPEELSDDKLLALPIVKDKDEDASAMQTEDTT